MRVVRTRHGREEGGFTWTRSMVNMAEAHPVLTVFVIALVVRIAVILFLSDLFSGRFVIDDGTYSDIAIAKASGDTAGWNAHTFFLYEATRTLLAPLTAIYSIFGPVTDLGRLFVAFAGAGTAALVSRLALEELEPRWALMAGGVVAFLPSQVLWSSLILKDALVWVLLATLGLVVALAARASLKRLFFLGLLAISALWLIAFLRQHTLVVASWALMLSCWVGAARYRGVRIGGGLLIGLLVPFFAGTGLGGWSLVTDAGSLEQRRLLNAARAQSAFIEVEEVAPETAAESDEDFGESIANVPAAATPSAGVPPTDEPAGAKDSAPAPLERDLAHLPKGVFVLLFEPVPWESGGSTSLKMARAESIVWYPLLALALVGLWSFRRYLRVVLFPLLAGGGMLMVYALTEGNIGTAYRHRGEFVWAVIVLAAIGGARLWRESRQGPGGFDV